MQDAVAEEGNDSDIEAEENERHNRRPRWGRRCKLDPTLKATCFQPLHLVECVVVLYIPFKPEP